MLINNDFSINADEEAIIKITNIKNFFPWEMHSVAMQFETVKTIKEISYEYRQIELDLVYDFEPVLPENKEAAYIGIGKYT